MTDLSASLLSLSFVVHGPPLPWQRARSARGQRFTSPEQREYQYRIRTAGWAAIAMLPHRWPTDARYAVTVHVYEGDAKRRDVDNHAKQCLDSLNGVTWEDDSQVDRISVERRWCADNPMVVVGVEVIPDERPAKKKTTRRKPTK